MNTFDWSSVQQFTRVVATFRPKRTDDLRPVAAEHIGYRGTWEALWVIDDGQFEGQWAMHLREPSPPIMEWVPQEDLEDVIPVVRA